MAENGLEYDRRSFALHLDRKPKRVKIVVVPVIWSVR